MPYPMQCFKHPLHMKASGSQGRCKELWETLCTSYSTQPSRLCAAFACAAKRAARRTVVPQQRRCRTICARVLVSAPMWACEDMRTQAANAACTECEDLRERRRHRVQQHVDKLGRLGLCWKSRRGLRFVRPSVRPSVRFVCLFLCWFGRGCFCLFVCFCAPASCLDSEAPDLCQPCLVRVPAMPHESGGHPVHPSAACRNRFGVRKCVRAEPAVARRRQRTHEADD